MNYHLLFEGDRVLSVTNEYVVIEQVAGQLTLRSGGDVVCVYNNSLYGAK